MSSKLLHCVETPTIMKSIINNPENIYQVFNPIYYMLKFFGLFPFSFDGPIKNGKFQFNFFDGLWAAIVLLIHSLFLFQNLKGFENSLISLNSSVLEYGYKVQILIGLLGSIMVSLNHLINKEKIKVFLEVLEKFDEQVRL